MSANSSLKRPGVFASPAFLTFRPFDFLSFCPFIIDNMKKCIQHLKIRDFVPDDYPQLMDVWYATGLGGAHRDDDLQTIMHSMELGGKMLVACLPEGRVIGTSWMTYDGRRMHLHHVGVLPDYQRHGIGRLLSEKSIRFAREKNIQVKLEVHRTNKGAIALYRELGFTYLGDYDVFILRSTRKGAGPEVLAS